MHITTFRLFVREREEGGGRGGGGFKRLLNPKRRRVGGWGGGEALRMRGEGGAHKSRDARRDERNVLRVVLNITIQALA
jgi:hypothetical protein